MSIEEHEHKRKNRCPSDENYSVQRPGELAQNTAKSKKQDREFIQKKEWDIIMKGAFNSLNTMLIPPIGQRFSIESVQKPAWIREKCRIKHEINPDKEKAGEDERKFLLRQEDPDSLPKFPPILMESEQISLTKLFDDEKCDKNKRMNIRILFHTEHERERGCGQV
jgi:hypothetical protein